MSRSREIGMDGWGISGGGSPPLDPHHGRCNGSRHGRARRPRFYFRLCCIMLLLTRQGRCRLVERAVLCVLGGKEEEEEEAGRMVPCLLRVCWAFSAREKKPLLALALELSSFFLFLFLGASRQAQAGRQAGRQQPSRPWRFLCNYRRRSRLSNLPAAAIEYYIRAPLLVHACRRVCLARQRQCLRCLPAPRTCGTRHHHMGSTANDGGS